MTLILEDKEYI